MKNFRTLGFLFVCSLLLANPAIAQKKKWKNSWKQGIKGQGAVVSQTFNLDKFTAFDLNIKAEVFLTKGSQSVKIEAQQNIIDNIKQQVKNGTWKIKFKKKVKDRKPIKIYISLPEVDGLAIGGAGKIIGQDAFEGLNSLDLSIAGAGKIEFAGSARSVSVSIAGAGNVKAGGLKTERCEVSIAGSGDCFIEVNNDLEVSIAGSGDVHYKGRPKVSSSIAGSGKIRSM